MGKRYRRVLRWGEGREFDGPLNGHSPKSWISEDLRWAIINMRFFSGLKPRLISKYTTVPRRSVDRIIANWKDHGGTWSNRHWHKRGGYSKMRASDEDLMVRIITEMPVYYIDEIRREMWLQSGHLFSAGSVMTALTNRGYTRRRLSKLCEKTSIQARILFRSKLTTYLTNVNQLIVIDETSKNRDSVQRRYGWSRRGVQLHNKGFKIKGKRFSVVGAYTTTGLLHYEVSEGTYNADKFYTWFINHIVPEINPCPAPQSIGILDNAAIHNRSSISQAVYAMGGLVFFLSPYSPDYSPIEKLWNVTKMYIKERGGYLHQNDDDNVCLLGCLTDADSRVDHMASFFSCGYSFLDPPDVTVDPYFRIDP